MLYVQYKKNTSGLLDSRLPFIVTLVQNKIQFCNHMVKIKNIQQTNPIQQQQQNNN